MKKFGIFIGILFELSLYSSDLNKQWVQNFKDLTSFIDSQKIVKTLLSSSDTSKFYSDPNHLQYATWVRQQKINQTIYHLQILTEQINSTLPQVKEIDSSSVFSGMTTEENVSISDISLPSVLRSRAHSISEASDQDNHEETCVAIKNTLKDQLAKKFEKDQKKLIELKIEEYRKKQACIQKQKQAQQSLFDKGRYALDQEIAKNQKFQNDLASKMKIDLQRYNSLIKQANKEKEDQARLLKIREEKSKEEHIINDAIFFTKLETQLQKDGIDADQLSPFVIRHAIKHSQLIYPQSFQHYNNFNDYRSEIDQHVIKPIVKSWAKTLTDRDSRLEQEQVTVLSNMFECVLTQALFLRYKESFKALI